MMVNGDLGGRIRTFVRRGAAAVLAAAVFFAAPARADTIRLANGLELEGKIIEETKEYVILRIERAGGEQVGSLRIPLSKIARDKNGKPAIEYDIATQLEKLAPDDWAGNYRVGVWAYNKGMYADAVRQFVKVKSKPGAGEELLKLLSKSYEQLGRLREARDCWAQWLLMHKDDAEALKRVAELDKQLQGTESAAPKKPRTVEGLEADGVWFGERWDNADRCRVGTTVDEKTGNRLIVMQTAGTGDHDKVAFTRVGPPQDFTGCTELRFRMYHNGSSRTQVALALISSSGEFFESRKKRVPANSWTTVSIPLNRKDFKSAQSNWKHTTDVKGKDKITRITFLIYGDRPTTLYLDGVGACRGGSEGR